MSIVMIFAAFTSAYIVKKGDVKVWEHIALPHIFMISTIVIAGSSICMHAAYLAYRKNRIDLFRGFILLTFILGASFLALQIQGWGQMRASGIFVDGNVAGSFLYVISGAHFVHVLGGVIALLVFSVLAFTRYKTGYINGSNEGTINKMVSIEVLMTYWHFVDILWIYLYFFFLINK